MTAPMLLTRALLLYATSIPSSVYAHPSIADIQASSTQPSSSHWSKPLLEAINPNNLLGQRSTLNIIWSCLATIFACTWASVHMNVPPASDSDWRVMRRRFKIMVYMLLLPEFILYWASKQWYGARMTANTHSSRSWTMTHGFFVGMGGFVLQENGKDVRPLDIEDLEHGSEMNELDWPEISEDDILDKSKGDYFTKGVVVLQTTWFIFQCIARWAIGLPITELEVVTLGFAVLSAAMCFFWLNKPLDVRRPVIVVGRGSSLRFSNGRDKQGFEDAELAVGLSSTRNPKDGPHRSPSTASVDGTVTDDGGLLLNGSPTQFVHGFSTPLSIFPNPPSEVLILDINRHNTSTPRHPTVTNVQESIHLPTPSDIRAIPRKNRRNLMSPSRRLTRKQILATLLSPFQTLISDMYELKSSGSIISQTDSRMEDNCHVSTFYAAVRLPIGHHLSLFLFVAGTIFGGIHCIAWTNQFPTIIEQWAWRASSLSVTILPLFFALHWIAYSFFDQAQTTQSIGFSVYGIIAVFKYVFFVTSTARLSLMFSVYILARLFLLVLPFASLRALPSSAYVDISWTNAIPHV